MFSFYNSSVQYHLTLWHKSVSCLWIKFIQNLETLMRLARLNSAYLSEFPDLVCPPTA